MNSVRSLEERAVLGTGPLTPQYDAALALAGDLHRGDMRKGSRVPYLSHLMSVSALVLEHGGSEQTAIAGLLHDAVEDAPAGKGPEVLNEIERRFGATVADIVRSCSDGLDIAGNRSGSWVQRKLPYIQNLPHKSPGSALVTAADKTHNARAIAEDVRAYGTSFWSIFNACPHQLAWYYGSVVVGLAAPLGGSTIMPVLDDAVEALVHATGVGASSLGAAPDPCDCPPR